MNPARLYEVRGLIILAEAILSLAESYKKGKKELESRLSNLLFYVSERLGNEGKIGVESSESIVKNLTKIRELLAT